jgi:hypothetical protein
MNTQSYFAASWHNVGDEVKENLKSAHGRILFGLTHPMTHKASFYIVEEEKQVLTLGMVRMR